MPSAAIPTPSKMRHQTGLRATKAERGLGEAPAPGKGIDLGKKCFILPREFPAQQEPLRAFLPGRSNNGYTITFDSNGGTDVPAQELMYGDYVAEPEPPTREGYTFAGWFKDENCCYPWDMEQSIVVEPVTLYALWIPESE